MLGADDVLYIATTNAGKLRDFAAAANLFEVTLLPLPGLREMPEPLEDGETFEANARKKAEHYSRLAPGLLVLADDSGLEVDALNGAPGVRSARFAEDAEAEGTAAALGLSPDATPDEWNNALLIFRLRDTPEPRTARYRCVLATARDGVVLQITEGSVEGEILRAPRGDGGFGYDPVFWLPDLSLTMAEIDLKMKQQMSHRGTSAANLALVRSVGA